MKTVEIKLTIQFSADAGITPGIVAHQLKDMIETDADYFGIRGADVTAIEAREVR